MDNSRKTVWRPLCSILVVSENWVCCGSPWSCHRKLESSSVWAGLWISWVMSSWFFSSPFPLKFANLLRLVAITAMQGVAPIPFPQQTDRADTLNTLKKPEAAQLCFSQQRKPPTGHSENHHQHPGQGAVLPIFPSRSFTVSDLTSVFNFELNFVSSRKYRSGFFFSFFLFLNLNIHFFQQHLFKRLPFPHWVFLAPLSNIS